MSSGTRDQGRVKLGLALSGGGLRASLFHLGVLRRMAELDLLRRVQVLSCVSGGAIIGALYALHLKKALEASDDERLEHAQYLDILASVERQLIRAVQKNLRNALFSNPLGTARVMLTRFTLGERMGELYEQHLFADVVEELFDGRPEEERPKRPGRMKLKEVAIRFPDEKREKRVTRGVDEYNAEQDQAQGSVLTKLVLNATSINSGARFLFSASEIGDRDLGYIRHDEADRLGDLKRCLRAMEPATRVSDRVVVLAKWLRARDKTIADPFDPGPWAPLLEGAAHIGLLADAKIGKLREAKIAAWYLRVGLPDKEERTGGLTKDEHSELFWAAMERIHRKLAGELRDLTQSDSATFDLLLDLVLNIYLLRTADYVAPSIEEDWEELTVGKAVAASACFPPVFAPFPLEGIYDERHVMRLGLTDGGVFDNIGVIGLLDEGCNHIIASDAGRDAKHQRTASASRVGLGARLAEMSLKNLEDTQHRLLREKADAAKRTPGPQALQGLAYFEIGSPVIPETLPLGLDSDRAAELRTDLDGFGDTEIAALVNSGYTIADRSIRDELWRLAPGGAWEPPTQLPMATPDKRVTNRVLRLGRRRFYRSLRMPHPLAAMPWLASILVVAGIVGASWGAIRTWRWAAARVDVGELWRAIPDGAWTTVGLLVVGFLGLRLALRRKRNALQVLAAIRRGVLGILLFPPFVLLVTVLTLYSWINHWCFHRPWLRMTKTP